MVRIKKYIILWLCAALVIGLLAGCGDKPKGIASVDAETSINDSNDSETATDEEGEAIEGSNHQDKRQGEKPKQGLDEGFLEDVARIEAAADSVVRLESYDTNGNRISTGSGFCAVREGILITAAHLITNMDHMIATKDDGETFEVGQIIARNQDYDFVICEIPDSVKMNILPVAYEKPHRGEKLAVISSMLGTVNMVTMGNCSGEWSEANKDWIIFTAPVSGGSSGAPIFNDRGEVIGIVSGTYEGGQNVNIAAPISAITSWLEDNEEE